MERTVAVANKKPTPRKKRAAKKKPNVMRDEMRNAIALWEGSLNSQRALLQLAEKGYTAMVAEVKREHGIPQTRHLLINQETGEVAAGGPVE